MREDIYSDLEKYENTLWWHVYKREVLALLIRKYAPKLKRKLQILDAGCGTGGTLLFLEQFGKTTGVDFSDMALAYCKNAGIKNVQKGSVENLKYKQEFNVITLLDVLEHVKEDKCLDSMHKSLQKEGILIVSVPAYQWMWSNWDILNKHHKRYTKKDLKKALEAHGFEVMRISYLYSFLVLPVFVARKIKALLYTKRYPSDIEFANSPIINAIMKIFCRLEFMAFSFFNIPFGLSVIAVAKKK